MLRLVLALVGRRYSHVLRVKQLTKVRKYLKPSYEGMEHGPQRLQCTISKDCDA